MATLKGKKLFPIDREDNDFRCRFGAENEDSNKFATFADSEDNNFFTVGNY